MILTVDTEKIKSFTDQVFANKITREDMTKINRGKASPPGDNPLYTIYLGPYKVVYTIEEGRKGKAEELFKHISISIPAKERLPNPIAVDEILTQFEFTTRVRKAKGAHIYVEDCGNGYQAVNIMEVLKSNIYKTSH